MRLTSIGLWLLSSLAHPALGAAGGDAGSPYVIQRQFVLGGAGGWDFGGDEPGGFDGHLVLHYWAGGGFWGRG